MSLKTIIVIIVVSIIVVGITPLIMPVTVTEPGQLSNLRFGAPLTFIQQEGNLQPPDDWFPNRQIILSPWENPTRILWGNFIASVLIVGIGLTVIRLIFTRIRKWLTQ